MQRPTRFTHSHVRHDVIGKARWLQVPAQYAAAVEVYSPPIARGLAFCVLVFDPGSKDRQLPLKLALCDGSGHGAAQRAAAIFRNCAVLNLPFLSICKWGV